MKKNLRNFLAGALTVLILANPCFAGARNFSATTTEYYDASSPVGSNTNYSGTVPQSAYYEGYYNQYDDGYNDSRYYAQYNNGYNNAAYYPEENRYNYSYNATNRPTHVAPTAYRAGVQTNSEPHPYNYGNYSSQTVQVPQSYTKETTVSYVDEREPIDKNIDRAGSIVGILSCVALVGGIVAAILK